MCGMRVATAIFILLVFFLSGTQAAELIWPTTPYSHFSNQEPLRDVLQSLAANQGIPIVVSKKIQDTVSITFEKLEPTVIFQRLIDAYNLTWYYDGHVLYVYRLDEMQTKTIKLNHLSVRSFKKSLQQLEILDERFSFRSIDRQGLIYLSGPSRLIELTLEMAELLDTEVQQKTPTDPVRRNTRVYKWKDKKGITHFSSAPPGRRVKGLRRLQF